MPNSSLPTLPTEAEVNLLLWLRGAGAEASGDPDAFAAFVHDWLAKTYATVPAGAFHQQLTMWLSALADQSGERRS